MARVSSHDLAQVGDAMMEEQATVGRPTPSEAGAGPAVAAPRSGLARVARWVALIPEGVLFVMMTVLTVLITVEVLLRSYIGNSLDYYTEAGTVLFAWTAFIGAAVMVKRRGHYAVRLLVQQLPDRVRSALRVTEDAITAAVSGIFFVQAVKITQLTSHEVMPVSGVSQAVYSASLAAGTALMVIYALVLLVVDSRRFLAGLPPDGGVHYEGGEL